MVYPTASMLSENYNNKQVAQEAVVLMPDGA
jgi:hypothetical protein